MDLIDVGIVARPHGIKGEIKVLSLANDASSLLRSKSLSINGRDYKVTSARENTPFVFIKLSGVDTRNDAEALRNAKVQIDRSDICLPKGTYFVHDLIGLMVSDESGNALGVLKDVFQYGAADVYAVSGDRPFSFPALKDVIVRVDIAGRKMILCAKRLKEVAVYEV